MSLFNFFKEKDKSNEKQIIQKVEQKDKQSIDIISIDNGSHRNNFSGLLGFHFLSAGNGVQFIKEYAAVASIKPPVIENETVAIKEVRFNEESTNSNNLGIRALETQGKIVSAYPYLKTSYSLPFKTKQIFEWSHIRNLEAEIKGGGRDTFGFGFFATDYAVNRDQYRNNEKLNIKVSAIGLVLDKSDLTEIGGQSISEEFTSYMPSRDIPGPTYYDYIGILIDYLPISLTPNNTGYIVKIKLINDESNPDFFTVDMFINKENMRIDKLEKGIKITGILWFQGEIE